MTNQPSSTTIDNKLQRISLIYNLPTVLTDKSIIVNSTATLDTFQSIITPKYAINNYPNNPNRLLDESQEEHVDQSLDKISNNPVVLGHCIIDNAGIPLNNLSKIPSYQWGFKHEDESTPDLPTKPKGTSTKMSNFKSNSISSLPGNVTTVNSTGLNATMIRLPISNTTINSYDKQNSSLLTTSGVEQGGQLRSLMNGLPYFDYKSIEKQIRSMNLHKKVNFKASNTNTSWFSDSLNKTIDDVEYLHGAVILNQFTNNKRIIRNYQWVHYWDNVLHGKSIDDDLNGDVITLKHFNELVIQRKETFKKLMEEKNALLNELAVMVKSSGVVNYDNMDEKIKLIKDKLITFPDVEEELDIIEFNKESARIQNQPTALDHSTRFGRNKEFNESCQIIYEKEYGVEDNELMDLQVQLHGSIKAKQIQSNTLTKKKHIKSKIVKLKRIPNPNALGFSNIRNRKPSYL